MKGCATPANRLTRATRTPSQHEELYSASSLFHQHRSPSHSCLIFFCHHFFCHHFLYLIFLYLLCSTSRPKSKPTSPLVDTTNNAPAVQLKDQGIPVQSVPEESQVSGRDEQTKKFEELINKKQYKEIAELGKDMSDEELLKCLCQVVTTLDQFKGLYEYLKQRNMVPGFLAHGEMGL